MDVFEKFPFQEKKNLQLFIYVGFKMRQELKQPVTDGDWTEGLHKAQYEEKQGFLKTVTHAKIF